MMTLDQEIYDIITKHFREGNTEVSEVLATLTNHITMIIRCLNETPEVKVMVAREVLGCAIGEIQKDPNPTARRMN